MYEKLQDNTLYGEYEYKDSNGEVKYKSYELELNGVSLIVSSTMDNVQARILNKEFEMMLE